MKKLFICFSVLVVVCFTTYTYATILLPVADGHYHYYHDYSCNICPEIFCPDCDVLEIEINNEIKVEDYYWKAPGHGARTRTGIVEFDISTIDGLYKSGEMQATIFLKVKEGNCCLTLYNIQDANENGTIAENDIETVDYIGEVCTLEQPGNTITFDVTSSLEHDLFNPDQTEFSGFVLKGCGDVTDSIEFYDHTDSENAPRLSISEIDSDGGGTAIPTLNEWGMIIFMSIIMGISVVVLSRRRME